MVNNRKRVQKWKKWQSRIAENSTDCKRFEYKCQLVSEEKQTNKQTNVQTSKYIVLKPCKG